MGHRDGRLRLPPSSIRFTQDSIRNSFSHIPKMIGETLDELCTGTCRVTDIPTIQVFGNSSGWWSLDNRRLWVFREYERLGGCSDVPVRRVFFTEGHRHKFTTKNNGLAVRIRGVDPTGYWHRQPNGALLKRLHHGSEVSRKSSVSGPHVEKRRKSICDIKPSTDDFNNAPCLNLYSRAHKNTSYTQQSRSSTNVSSEVQSYTWECISPSSSDTSSNASIDMGLPTDRYRSLLREPAVEVRKAPRAPRATSTTAFWDGMSSCHRPTETEYPTAIATHIANIKQDSQKQRRGRKTTSPNEGSCPGTIEQAHPASRTGTSKTSTNRRTTQLDPAPFKLLPCEKERKVVGMYKIGKTERPEYFPLKKSPNSPSEHTERALRKEPLLEQNTPGPILHGLFQGIQSTNKTKTIARRNLVPSVKAPSNHRTVELDQASSPESTLSPRMRSARALYQDELRKLKQLRAYLHYLKLQ